MTTKLPNGDKIYQLVVIHIFQISINCTEIFHSWALQNIPKLEFLVLKWQPWYENGNPGMIMAILV
jgi:hypothetical protein